MHLKFLALVSGLLCKSMASDLPSQPGVVPMSFSVHRPTLDINTLKRAQALRKRDDGTSSVGLLNLLTSYVAQIQVGTPGQNISTVLDTGSSDLWVMSDDNPYCAGSPNYKSSMTSIDCSSSTTFKSGDSSSFSDQDSDFSISYGDGSAAVGKFVQDIVQIGSFSISKANFALANEANTTMAVFGIGPIYGESTVTKVTQDGSAHITYDNLLVQMKSQGYISSLSFSIWLNQANSEQGNVIFGGVDHGKYKNSLVLLPILRDLNPGSISDIQLQQARSTSVKMTGLGLYKDSDTEIIASGSFPVLLDSGTSLTYLPTEFLDVLGSSIGATWSASINLWIITCEHEGGVVFELGGSQFQVPFQQMIYRLTEDGPSGAPTNATDENGDTICALGVMSSGDFASGSTFILGETFLRGVYVSFDYDNWQVGIAQANYDDPSAQTSSNIETIGSGGIPSATSAPSYSDTSFENSFTTIRATLFNSDSSIDDDRTYDVDTSASSDQPTSMGSSSSSNDASGKGGSVSQSSSSSGSEFSSDHNRASSSSSHSSNPAAKVPTLTGLSAPLMAILLSI